MGASSTSPRLVRQTRCHRLNVPRRSNHAATEPNAIRAICIICSPHCPRDMRCGDELPCHRYELRSGTIIRRRRSCRRQCSPKSSARRSANGVLHCIEGSIAGGQRTHHPLRSQGRLGRYVLRSSRSSMSVLANARIYVREDERWALRRRLHLRRQAIVRLKKRPACSRGPQFQSSRTYCVLRPDWSIEQMPLLSAAVPARPDFALR